MEIDIALVNF